MACEDRAARPGWYVGWGHQRVRATIMRRLAAAVLGVLLAASGVTHGQPEEGGGGGGGPPPAVVITDAARTEVVQQHREVTGELRASRRSVLAAEQAGLVETITVEAGDVVKAGQVLATLDSALQAQELERAKTTIKAREAMLAERRAVLEQARRDRERVRQSFERQSASQSEMDSAETKVVQTEAMLAQVEAEIAWARSDEASAARRLSDLTIRAPFAGVVVEKRTEVGQWLSQGDPVADVVALDPIDAWLDVPEVIVPWLVDKEDGPLEVELRLPGLGNQSRRARISAVIAAGERLSRLFPVRVRLANTDGSLRPGMSVVGVLPTGSRLEMMTVHKDAVIFGDAGGGASGRGATVWMEVGGSAAPMTVNVLWATPDGKRLVVQAERLKAGTPLIVEGNERLFPGQPVQATARAAAAVEPGTKEEDTKGG